MSLEKSEKLGNYLSWSLVCFKYRNYFGSIDDVLCVAFPLFTRILLLNIPLESMKSASPSQITELLTANDLTNYCRENVS
jgi:hypothetical protein